MKTNIFIIIYDTLMIILALVLMNRMDKRKRYWLLMPIFLFLISIIFSIRGLIK